MILRLSQQLAARTGTGPLAPVPSHDNPLLDWSAQLFAVGRAEYVLLCNTRSLYSIVLDDVAFGDAARVLERVAGVIRAALDGAGAHGIATAAAEPARVAKALNRSVTGSMTELVAHATALLADGRWPAPEVGYRLNGVLLSALAGGAGHYGRPREAFAVLVAGARA